MRIALALVALLLAGCAEAPPAHPEAGLTHPTTEDVAPILPEDEDEAPPADPAMPPGIRREFPTTEGLVLVVELSAGGGSRSEPIEASATVRNDGHHARRWASDGACGRLGAAVLFEDDRRFPLGPSSGLCSVDEPYLTAEGRTLQPGESVTQRWRLDDAQWPAGLARLTVSFYVEFEAGDADLRRAVENEVGFVWREDAPGTPTGRDRAAAIPVVIAVQLTARADGAYDVDLRIQNRQTTSIWVNGACNVDAGVLLDSGAAKQFRAYDDDCVPRVAREVPAGGEHRDAFAWNGTVWSFKTPQDLPRGTYDVYAYAPYWASADVAGDGTTAAGHGRVTWPPP